MSRGDDQIRGAEPLSTWPSAVGAVVIGIARRAGRWTALRAAAVCAQRETSLVASRHKELLFVGSHRVCRQLPTNSHFPPISFTALLTPTYVAGTKRTTTLIASSPLCFIEDLVKMVRAAVLAA